MGNRLQLQQLLEEIPGVNEVYFQPPESVKLVYPCIVFSRDSNDTKHADDVVYNQRMMYKITIIDQNPDSAIPAYVASLPLASYSRYYRKDNLNHDVYNLYF